MKVAVIGAGLMGRAAAFDLARAQGVEKVGVFDIDEQLAKEIANKYGDGKAVGAKLDAGDEAAATRALTGYDAAVSCVTYKFNPGLTRAAIAAKCHLVDLGGNNDVVNAQIEMDAEAEKAGVIIVPDCGLAPGMVSIMVADGIAKLDKAQSVKIRVGGLPQSPRPPLNYQMVFSAEGLINEYWEPCVILEDGKKKTVNPMTGLELLAFDGIGKLEAFYTSGGTSTLPDTYEGKIDFLDYKTIRYPGHCQIFKAMLEIGLGSRQPVKIDNQPIEPRAVLKAVLDKNLSFGQPDLVLVRVEIEGEKDGALKTIIYEIVDRQDSKTGLTAMMRTTSFPAAIIAWMAAGGQITARGVKPQEIAVNPSIFLPQLKKRGILLTIKE
ncbi:saccharopine dehydrogenase [candidate division GN15 bacterium]|uniref:Saccharopine dehydrogenase n=1 Tax=candidate division GN15 bacterium TaxID=2072418 RepID=A0A855X4A2_9BACT|nr:MAG: saccharopine dehydrogenase [candidate division GN15 bacterium]